MYNKKLKNKYTKKNSNKNTNKKPKTYTKTYKKTILQGGKFLGEGAYGCVITPPLPCILPQNLSKNKYKYTNKNININIKKHIGTQLDTHLDTQLEQQTDKSVSKIIIAPNRDSNDEITISSLIKHFDPHQKYFITYDNYCYLQKIPSNRNNTSRVKYTNKKRDHYFSLDNKGRKIQTNNNSTTKNSSKHNDANKCLIDLSLKPINIIMPYGGYDLISLKNDYSKKYKQLQKLQQQQQKQHAKHHAKHHAKYMVTFNKYEHFIKTYDMIKLHFKPCFKNLLIGLYKLHKANIFNRDIKTENIMANYNEKTKKVDLRYIDFGLSNHLTPEFCSKYNNITFSGTEEVIAPEIYITFIILEFDYHNKYVINKKFDPNTYSNYETLYFQKMKQNIKYDIDKNVLETFKLYKEYEYIDNMYSINHSSSKNYKIPIFDKLFNTIKSQYDNKTILNAYFGTNNVNSLNGYLQKGDVYSLGCAMYEYLILNYKIIDLKQSNNLNLHNLLKKMIHPDPYERLNVLECLQHQYFK